MKRERRYVWFLKIEKTQNVNFCRKYKNIKELSLEKNKRIINNLIKSGVKEICWIGDEAIDYPRFSELIKYAKQKEIKCEILFNNIFECNLKKIKKIISYIDVVTINIDLIAEGFNSKYDCQIFKFLTYFQDKVQVNALTMTNSEIVKSNGSNIKKIGMFKINTWIILGFMPILLDMKIDIEKYFVSKINYRQFHYSQHYPFISNIEHFWAITEYSISRYYNIILPNADIAVINEKDSIIIGNILNDTSEQIDRNYKNRRKFIIPKQSEQKVKILIASSNSKLVKEIKEQLEQLKYVDIIGISKNGKDSYVEILNKKPDMVFLQYDFKDLSGYNIIMKLSNKMEAELPAFNIITNHISDDELSNMIRATHSKLNAWIHKNDYKERFLDIVKQYKNYRDKD